MRTLRKRTATVLRALLGFLLIGSPTARAIPYEFPLGGTFSFLRDIFPNSIGQPTGLRNLFGIYCAVPSGEDCDDPTVDHSGTSATAIQGTSSLSLRHFNLSVQPNHWFRSTAFTDLTGQWLLQFENGGDVTGILTPDLSGARQVPFVDSTATRNDGARTRR